MNIHPECAWRDYLFSFDYRVISHELQLSDHVAQGRIKGYHLSYDFDHEMIHQVIRPHETLEYVTYDAVVSQANYLLKDDDAGF